MGSSGRYCRKPRAKPGRRLAGPRERGRGGPSSLFVVDAAGQPLAELGFVALADGWFEARYATEGSPRVGFELVHSASYCLWGEAPDVVELDRAAAE